MSVLGVGLDAISGVVSTAQNNRKKVGSASVRIKFKNLSLLLHFYLDQFVQESTKAATSSRY